MTDEEANNSMTYTLAQSGLFILKWKGFSIVNVNGKLFAEMNYYQYASGGTLTTGDPIVVKILSYQKKEQTFAQVYHLVTTLVMRIYTNP